MIIGFSCQGFVSWGLPLHLISIFEHMGVATATAVAIASLAGPATIAARLIEIVVGSRVRPMTTALMAMAVLPLSFALLVVNSSPAMAATAFTVLWCGATGIMAIVRAVLPLSLFGREGYGATMGRLALPQNLAFGAAPLVFAVVLERFGTFAAVWTAVAASIIALIAVIVLARLVRDPGGESGDSQRES